MQCYRDSLTSRIARICYPFPGNGFVTQKLSIQITMKSCHFVINHSVVNSFKQTQRQNQSYVTTDGHRPVYVSSTHLRHMARFLLLSDSCGFVDVRCSLWRENGSAVYNCCWSSPAQSFLGLSPVWLRFESPQRGGSGPRIYIPQEQGRPIIPPGTGFPFHRLLWLAGLRWRYLNPPPRGRPFSVSVINLRRGPHRKHLLLPEL
jgi:hypothetical protein